MRAGLVLVLGTDVARRGGLSTGTDGWLPSLEVFDGYRRRLHPDDRPLNDYFPELLAEPI